MSIRAGRVMLGADGHVMRGHAGEIVLADNLYPMHATVSGFQEWYRYHWRDMAPPAADNGVGGETWIASEYPDIYLPFSTELDHSAYRNSDGVLGTSWDVWQKIRKYTLSGVDWTRVAKMKVSYLLRTWCTYRYAIPYKWYWGINNATAPSGSNEPWEGTGWTLLANVTGISSTAYDYGVIDVTGCNGTFWIAGFGDVTTSPLNPDINEGLGFRSDCYHSFGGTYGETTYPEVEWEIVYNLAT